MDEFDFDEHNSQNSGKNLDLKTPKSTSLDLNMSKCRLPMPLSMLTDHPNHGQSLASEISKIPWSTPMHAGTQ